MKFDKSIKIGLLFFLGSGTIVAGQSVPKIKDIYLCIGQSNMAGVAPILELEQQPLAQTWLLNEKGDWELAVCTNEGLNRYASVRKTTPQLLGPSYSFARKLETVVDAPIGMVSNARGGTQIEWWQKGYQGQNDFDLYERALERAKLALQRSPGSKIKAILWHQGEGDNASPRKEVYLTRLRKLVEDLRNDLGDRDIPLIAGEVGTWKGRGKGINAMIRQVQDSIANASWVSSEGFTSIDLEKNDPHFDTFSQRSLGGRYADKVMEICYGLPKGGVTFFNGQEFSGRSVELKEGNYPVSWLVQMGISLEEIVSITVDKGYQIVFLSEGKPLLKLGSNRDNWKAVSFDKILVTYKKK